MNTHKYILCYVYDVRAHTHLCIYIYTWLYMCVLCVCVCRVCVCVFICMTYIDVHTSWANCHGAIFPGCRRWAQRCCDRWPAASLWLPRAEELVAPARCPALRWTNSSDICWQTPHESYSYKLWLWLSKVNQVTSQLSIWGPHLAQIFKWSLASWGCLLRASWFSALTVLSATILQPWWRC